MQTDAVGPDDVEVTEEMRFCFLNSARECKADCMAFLVVPPEGKDYEGHWAHCSILVNLHKTGKHAVAIAQQAQGIVASADSLLKFLKIKKADDLRGPPPAPPKGG